VDNVQPAWSSARTNPQINPTGTDIYLAFASTRRDVPVNPNDPGEGIASFAPQPASTFDIYYVPAQEITPGQGEVTPEAPPNEGENPARKLDTVDPNYEFNDEYPAFAQFINLRRICHQSDRTGTLRRDATGQPFVGGFTRTPGVHDLFLDTVIDITAPTIIRYDTSRVDGEVVHINQGTAFNPSTAASVRNRSQGLLPGVDVFFTIRLEDRESGLRRDASSAGAAAYLVFKNPNSKYQQNRGVEHKEWFDSGFISPLTIGTAPLPFTIDVAGFGGATQTTFFGHEFEAQAISAFDRVSYFNHTLIPNNPGPVYTASSEDLPAFSGAFNPPLDGRTYRLPDGTDVTTPNIWLQLQRLPDNQQDNQGGVLYGATWRLPAEETDWFIDVVAYDNALNPFDLRSRYNWIIYDNVWGFSTASFDSSKDILVVSDYALGQKFFGTRFGERLSAGNDNNLFPGLFYGSESYFTDIAAERNPRFAQTTGTDPRAYAQSGMFTVNPVLQANDALSAFGGRVVGLVNTLGVNSYTDEYNDDSRRLDNRPVPPENQYEIWRILARGPVPIDVLNSYLPQPEQQTPPDLRVNEPTPRTVRSARRLVVWNSPLTINLFVGPGTIVDQTTQRDLTTFVNSGGRLFISGQDIGFALTFNGSRTPEFYRDILKAQFLNDQVPFPNGSFLNSVIVAGRDNSIADEPWERVNHAYGFFDGTTPFPYSPPSAAPIPVLNNTAPVARFRHDAARTSGSFGTMDLIQPLPGTGPNDPFSAYAQFNYENGVGAGIITSQFASGGRVAYSSLGFESVGYEWYEAGTPTRIFHYGRRAEIMHNITCSFRTGTITGRVTNANQGGAPLPGVLVRAVANSGAEGTRALYTAVTDQNGQYQLIGLKPDSYVIFGYLRGFTIQKLAGIPVHGGSVSISQTDLSLSEVPPGAVTGKVFRGDAKTPLPGIEVQLRARNADGSIAVLRGVSGADGTYNISGVAGGVDVAVGFYEVIANPSNDTNGDGTPDIPQSDPRFNANYNPAFSTVALTDPAQNGKNAVFDPTLRIENGLVFIESGKTTRIDFILTSPPQPVSGRVFTTVNGQQVGVAGAIVTANRNDAAGNPLTTTTDANGNYAFGPLAEGELILTVSAPSYAPATKTLLISGRPITSPEGDIELFKQPPGSISGLVRNIATGQPVSGVTVLLLFNNTEVQRTVTTAASGDPVVNFRFATVDTGSYTLRAIAPDPATRIRVENLPATTGTQADAPIVVETAKDTRVVFETLPPGSISGLVVNNSNNNVIVGATVRLYQGETLIQTTTTTARQVAADGYVFNYRFDNVPVGDYNVRVEFNGLPVDFERIGVTVRPGTEERNINFRLFPLKVYANGIQMISTPRDYSNQDPRSVFGFTAGGDNDGDGTPGTPNDEAVLSVFNLAEWTGQDYNISPDLRLQVGKGYFARFGATATVQSPGGPTGGLGSTRDIALPYAGWHIIGNPFDPSAVGDIDLATSVRVVEPTDYNGDGQVNYSLAEAVRPGTGGTVNGVAIALVRDIVFYYTGSTGGSQYIQDTRLRPWLGYWFRSFQPVTLRLTAPTTRSVSAGAAGAGNKTISREQLEAAGQRRSLVSTGAGNWRLQIAARQSGPQGDLLDTDNSIGVAPEAKDGFDFRFDNEKPPQMTQAPSVYLALQGQNETGRAAAFTDDIRSAGGGVKTWEFTVAPGGTGDVTVFWPNIARVPRDVVPTLVDAATGKRIPMRSASSYRFTPASNRSVHRFLIEVRPPLSAPLRFVNVRTVVTGKGVSRATRFAFQVTQEAEVVAEVQTLGGKMVRRLQTRARANEESGVTWDGRRTDGSALPAGPYLLRLTARDANGNVVSDQRPVLVRN